MKRLPYRLIEEARQVGNLILLDSGKLLVELPKGKHADLMEALRANREQIRTILTKQKNAKAKRRKPKPAPEPLMPDSVPIAVQCTCSEHPYPHAPHRETVAGFVSAPPYDPHTKQLTIALQNVRYTGNTSATTATSANGTQVVENTKSADIADITPVPFKECPRCGSSALEHNQGNYACQICGFTNISQASLQALGRVVRHRVRKH